MSDELIGAKDKPWSVLRGDMFLTHLADITYIETSPERHSSITQPRKLSTNFFKSAAELVELSKTR
jgi:hypothetical protein